MSNGRFERSTWRFIVLQSIVSLLIVGATGAAIWLLIDHSKPLGNAEWSWRRSTSYPTPVQYVVPVASACLLVGVATFGHRALDQGRERFLWFLFPMLLATGALFHLALFDLPVVGLERWPMFLTNKASSGYFEIGSQIRDPIDFVKNYRTWIDEKDSFHIGTHPPGLFLLNWGAARTVERFPELSKHLGATIPKRFVDGANATKGDRGGLIKGDDGVATTQIQSLWLVSLTTWIAVILTALPVYGLARLGADPPWAWGAASLWLLTPAPLCFLPSADCLYPLIAATSILLLVWSIVYRTAAFALIGGLIWTIGAFCSWAFLALLPIVIFWTVVMWFARRRPRLLRMFGTLAAFSAGILIPAEILWYRLGVNIADVASVNLTKHAGFYQAMPRNYSFWVGANLVEFLISTGPAAVIPALLALVAVRCRWIAPDGPSDPDEYSRPTPAGVLLWAWLLTLLALNFSGKNLSETARLWMFIQPFVVASCGVACRWFGNGPYRLALIGVAQAAVTLTAAIVIEPLLPVGL